ncbi:hypothetical protein POTOM_010003 [Populus tomentosa]|uniref:Uncharacterized protein n=1 Tax=Populus tomentosa TaxID=118781 RepID=A0A8X8DAL4_POPTO|nr:hypothetical protein POTOM_010003 [Populus tomentosa]
MADHAADVVKEVAEKMGKVAEEVADHPLEEGEDSKWFALCSPIAGQFAKSVKGQQWKEGMEKDIGVVCSKSRSGSRSHIQRSQTLESRARMTNAICLTGADSEKAY